MSIQEVLEDYFSYIGASEAPVVYHRWSFLACMSAAMGRSAFLEKGHFTVYPNLYVMLMGDPGARKSTSILIAKDILENSGYEYFSANHSTQERFLSDLEVVGTNDIEESCARQFICAHEFNNFMGEGNVRFISALTELFDGGVSFESRHKAGKNSVIHNPYVVLLGGNTHQNFGTCFPPAIINNGFLSRMLLVWGQKQKKVSNPPALCPEHKSRLAQFFRGLQQNRIGALAVTPNARDAMDEIYEKWNGLDDGRFLTYSERRHLHLQKLIILCSAGVGKIVITYDDVVYANTMLAGIERDFSRAIGEFGKSKTAEEASIVMGVLYAARGPVSLNTIWSAVATALQKYENLRDILHGLIAAGKIDSDDGLFIARPQREIKLPHLNFSLLQEFQNERDSKRTKLLHTDSGEQPAPIYGISSEAN